MRRHATITRGGSWMGTKEGLNSKDIGLELKFNSDLRLSNIDLMEKYNEAHEGAAAHPAPGSAPDRYKIMWISYGSTVEQLHLEYTIYISRY